MRFLTVALLAASLSAVARAQTAYFPFPPQGPCIASCTDSAGKFYFPMYDDVNENGPFFLESLSYNYESGTAKAIAFMNKAGPCFATCPMPEQDLYRAQYPLKRAWYNANK